MNGTDRIVGGFLLFPGLAKAERRDIAPMANIRADRCIFLNAVAYKLLGKPTYALLYWNETDRAILIRPCADGQSPAACLVRADGAKETDTRGRLISARSFLQWAGIIVTGSTAYVVTASTNGGIVIDLKDAAASVQQRSPRAGRSAKEMSS